MGTPAKEIRKQAKKIRRYEKRLLNLASCTQPEIRTKLERNLESAKRKLDRLQGSRPRPISRLRLVSKTANHPLIPKLGAPHPDYVRDDDFYSSDAWRKLRYLALRNVTGCQCCGARASDGIKLHVDHIQPRYKRPDLSLILDNLQVLCEDCNMGKGAWDSTDWRIKMR